MALNKQQTAGWMKIMIVALAAVMAMTILLPFLGSLDQPAGSQGNNNAQGTNSTVAAKYTGRIATNDSTLQKTPTDYNTLVDQGNAYFDWAGEIQQQTKDGSDRPMWISATTYYERALKIKAGDPAVTTDMSIAFFYAGNTTRAAALVDEVLKKNPTFAPALFNGGIFYENLGNKAKAIDYYQRYLKADPKGESGNRQTAEEKLKGLGVPSK